MNHPLRIRVAALVVLAALTGCSSVPTTGSSLPDQVIVNEPRIVGSREPVLEALPLPAFRPPLHDELPAEAIHYPDVMDRIRSGMSLPDVEHPWVTREFEWFQRNPEYLNRVFGRAQRYLHHITNEVVNRGMPLELALLPVVESAFNPFAYSKAHASGLWQFIPSTGKLYGLERSYWQDQRRDVLESTRAALDFLDYLNKRFNGDWFLAIAAYNTGPGNVQRAINRNTALGRPTDFFSLSLPSETRAYVPKLIALARLMRDPAAHGLEMPPLPDAPYFRVIPTESSVDLRLMAEIAGVEVEEMHALNPSWNRWVTDPTGPHRVLVPDVVADRFVNEIAGRDAATRARLIARRVEPGESITSIASKFQIPESYLRHSNSLPSGQPKAGDSLLVPAGSVAQLRAGLGADLERRIHLVSSGDSLWSISRRHGMTVANLARLNNISTRATIRPGQRLIVSGPAAGSSAASASTPSASGRSLQYTVRSGDTLSAIARRFRVTVRQLQSWNEMGAATALRAGQRLTIHTDGRRELGG